MSTKRLKERTVEAGAHCRAAEHTPEQVLRCDSEEAASRAQTRSEEQFRLLFEQAVDGIFVSDADGHYLDVNTAGCEMLGHSREEILGRNIADVVAPEERERIRMEVTRLAGGRVTRTEWRFVRKDGSTFMGEVVARQLHDGRLQAILRDISKRKQAEDALQREKERLLALVNSIPDEVWVADSQGRMEMVNPAAASEFGTDFARGDVEGVIRKAEIYRADGSLRPVEEAPLLRALRGETVKDQEEIMGSPRRGELRWRQVSASPFRNATGKILGAVAVVRDVTKRKRAEEALRESEEKFRLIFTESSVGKAEADPVTGRYLSVNRELCRITGYSEAQLLGRSALEITHPEDREADRERFIRLIRGDVESYTCEKRYLRPDGNVVWAEVTVNLLRDSAGRPRRTYGVIQDVTARKRAQEMLREREEQLSKLADNLPDSVVYQYLRKPGEPIGHFTYLSAGIEKITGVKVEDALTNAGRLHGLIEPGHLERLMEEEARCVRELADFEIEVPMRRTDGDVRWMSIRSRPRRLSDGSVVWDGVQTDITERRQAEEAVKRARDRSDILSRTISRLLSATDPQSVVQDLCNEVRQFLKCDVFFNFLLDHKTQRLRYNACGGVDPCLAKKVENLELGASLCGTAARDGSRVHAQNLWATKDPRSALLRSLGIRAYACHPLMGPGNEVLGTLSFGARDRDSFNAEDLDLMKSVTDHVAIAMLRRHAEQARAEAEDRLRTVLRAVGVGLWLHEPILERVDWDERTREMLFLGAGEEPTMDLFWSRMHPDDRESTRRELEAALRENRVSAFDHRAVDSLTGRMRWMHSEGKGFHDPEGRLVRFDGISYDITERKTAEAVLARDKAELERLVAERTAKLQELVAELEHFSYTITHDLKAPLRAMRGFAEVANQMCAEAEAKPFLEKISTAAERMDLLIRDALDYSQAVRRELPLEDVDTGALLRGILDSYPQFQSWKAHIQVKEHLPVVLGNEAGLTQCFSNLLGNAVKFVKERQLPEVLVWAEVLAHRDGWVRIWVEDKGIGIAREMLPRVFDMFSRANKEFEGTGIGLALVRKVVQRMGGRVGVESEEGKGSRFWMELKLGRESQPAKDLAKTGNTELRGGTILYVEDEENDVMFMERALAARGMGSALRVAGDGRVAIDYLSGAGKYADRKKYPLPSVVLLDLNLPAVSGFAVLEWMRNNPDFARTPVVVFSSSTLEADRIKARELGANEFLAKPSSGMDFGRVVDELKGNWMH